MSSPEPRPALLGPAAAPRPAAGSLGSLGPYEVLAELGAGAFGAVYLAEHRTLRVQRALKVLKRPDGPGALERFRREAQHLAHIRHDNVVRVHEYGADRHLYLVMDLVPGQGLDRLIEAEAPLPEPRARAIAAGIAAGVAALHAQGVVHRDLKPGNVIVTPEGRPVVVDFGLAVNPDEDARLTKTGALVGTLAYLPPEALGGGRVAPSADVYAIAAILYELLTGQRVVQGSPEAVVGQLLSRASAPRVADLRPDVTPALDALCARALAREPAARPADARALLAELERLPAYRPTVWGRLVARARRAGRSRVLGALALAAGLGGLGVGLVLTGRLSPPTAPPPPAADVDWARLASEREAEGDLDGAVAALGSALAAGVGSPDALRPALLVRRAELVLRRERATPTAAPDALRPALADLDEAVAALASAADPRPARDALRARAAARAAAGDLDGALADLEALAAGGDPEAAAKVSATLLARVERALLAPRLSRAAARALLADAERLLAEDARAPEPRRAVRAHGARGVARWALRREDSDEAAARAAQADLDAALRRAEDPRLRLERARTWSWNTDTVNIAADLERVTGPLPPATAVIRAEVASLVGLLERRNGQTRAKLDDFGSAGTSAGDEGVARLEAALQDLDEAIRAEDSPYARLLRSRVRRWLRPRDEPQAAEDEAAALRGADALEASCPQELVTLLLGRRETARALVVLGRVVARDRDDLDALRQLAALRLAGGDAAAAKDDLERLVAASPGDPSALQLRGRARALTGDAEGALLDLRAWRDAAPLEGSYDHAHADRQAALLEGLRDVALRRPETAPLARGEVFRAFELVEAGRAAPGATPAERAAAAKRASAAAEAALDRALEQVPDLAPALRMRAELRRARGALDPALADLAALAAADPGDVAAAAQRAELLFGARRFGEARDAARAGLARAPEDVRLRLAEARALAGLGEVGAAREAVDGVLARDPGSLGGNLVRARLRIASADLSGAAADVAAAASSAQAAGERALVLQVQAELAAERGDLPGAVACLDEALALAQGHALAAARAMLRGALGDSAGAGADLALAERLAGRTADATAYRALAQLHRQAEGALPGDAGKAARAALLRGVWREERRDRAGALAAYDEAVRLAPDVVLVRQRRAAERHEAGDRAGALVDLERWIELEPRSGLALYDRAVVRLAQSDRAGGKADLERSLVVEPGHPQAARARELLARLAGGAPSPR